MTTKNILAVMVFLGGLYVVAFYSGTNFYYLGLVAMICGGWWIGKAIRGGNAS